MSFAKNEFKFSYLIVVAEIDKIERKKGRERERKSGTVCHPTIVKTRGEIIPKSIFRKAHNAVIALAENAVCFAFYFCRNCN